MKQLIIKTVNFAALAMTLAGWGARALQSNKADLDARAKKTHSYRTAIHPTRRSVN